jgi:cytidylate kinase
MVITIDGPAGSGKSTAARNLAAALNIAYLDTGATYRAATLRALRQGVDLRDDQALAETARRADIRLVPHDQSLRVLLDGEDVSRDIRTQRVTDSAYHLAGSPLVRKVLVELQRRIGSALSEFVSEGRDQGTVVFPDADVKFFLDATADVRARRRCLELQQAGEDARYEEVLESIVQRDRRDRGRAVGPLAVPADAVHVDTTDKTPDETLDALLAGVRERAG